jgi:ATP/maltotriose-dependent transcriptional regulator MalT
MSPRTLLALHRLRGETLYYFGRYVESLEEHDRALAIARRERDHREVALETVRRANVLGMIPGRFEEAVADYRRAIASLVDQGDNGEAAYALLYLGVVLSQHGRGDAGLDALKEARALAEQAHDQRRLGWSLFNIADLERERGHLADARTASQQAREILLKIGDRYGLVQTEIVQGKIHLQAGELDQAEVELLEAFRLVRELNIPADEAEVVLRLAETALARGDRAGAAAHLTELDRLDVDRVRPDLVTDYRNLAGHLGEGGDSPG